jgi:TolB-like protein/Tfp pilus assembly protein PilF
MAKDGDDEKASGSTPSVFISYASLDSVIAETACEALEKAGVTCWIAPRDVIPGAFYGDEIVHAIDAAKAIVLILSQNAATSPHVLREVERAASKRHAVISLRIDKAPLPAGLEYFLNTSQWLDASSGDTVRALPKLVAAVQVATQAPAGTPTAVPTALAPAPAMSARSRKRMALVVASVVGLALVGLAAHRLWLSTHRAAATPATTSAVSVPAPAAGTPAIPEKSVAVLPFVDMSEKKDQEYFSDGLSEELIDMLAKVPGLRVPARTSSFYFKGKPTKLPDIARELGVAHILEGSVRKSNNRIRVTAQLIRADTGFHVWSETYDRGLSDIFKVQDDIANAVVRVLQITLTGGPLTRQTGGTQNLEAYQLYLRALDAQSQNTRSSLEAAGGYLDQAIKLDPNFGLAWSTLALTVIVQTDNGLLSPKEGYERSRQLAKHALQSSRDLADAHAALQYIHRTYDWDWAASEAEGRQALSIDPTNQLALMFSGMLSATLGRWGNAERELRAALARDPLNTYANSNLGDAMYCAGLYADAEAAYRKVLDLAPHFLWARMSLGKILLAEGKFEAALAMVQDEATGYRRLMLPILLHANGRNAEAEEALKDLSKSDDPYFVAMTYAYRGDHDRALESLDRSYKERDPNLVEIVGEPLFKSLANDPRYKAFLRKMNLPE